ncbi:MAG: molybdopterin molybdotransferase MoeA [Gammaproteobacteria bacterium]|nr:molybdopterin molybdotransferase MoeA [Gammaproteobacteria bacterium]MYI89482.1 molybdopterin molybdotransferase MoeA [Gammaproteobacteria bacterium]
MEQQSQNFNDCFDPRSGLVPIAEAEERVFDQVSPLSTTEVVSLPKALGRVLANPATSSIDVPPHANSAMDGFAIAGKALPDTDTKAFEIVGEALAGKPWHGICEENQTVRVTTGAMMPKGTDSVIIQEDVTVEGDQAIINAGHKAFANVRQAGEDLKRGEVTVESGTKLGPAELGVLASTGIGRVEVVRKPIAAVFSTGDELMNAGETLVAGSIYDSNRYVLMGLLQKSGADVINLGVIPDDYDKTLEALSSAHKKADLIITSGGVSTGSADFVIKALEHLGSIDLWRIAIRPGRPFAFGRIGDALFFGLPGNPVAVMVTYYRLLLPALRKLMGEHNLHPAPVLKARATTSFRKKPNRAEVYRAILSRDEFGNPVVSSTGQQGSGLLSSMSQANCFVLLDDNDTTASPGDMVDVQPFHGLI